MMPCRNLASLMNTLSPPHAPVRLVAPLASLAPLVRTSLYVWLSGNEMWACDTVSIMDNNENESEG